MALASISIPYKYSLDIWEYNIWRCYTVVAGESVIENKYKRISNNLTFRWYILKDQVQVLYYFFIIKLGNKNDEKNER